MKVTDQAGHLNSSRAMTAMRLSPSLTEGRNLSPRFWPRSLSAAVSFFALVIGFGSPRAQAQSEEILYSFTGTGGTEQTP
jgi:hypothetical protein